VSGNPTNPEATDHAETLRTFIGEQGYGHESVTSGEAGAALDALLTERDEAEDTLTRYRNALERYGDHLHRCSARGWGDCDCGYRAALDGPKEAEARARELRRVTTDDSENEPPDFEVDDGLDGPKEGEA